MEADGKNIDTVDMQYRERALCVSWIKDEQINGFWKKEELQ